MTKSFSQEHGKLNLAVRPRLRGQDAVGDAEGDRGRRGFLSFIHHLRVTMTADGGGSSPIELGIYQPAGAAAGRELTLSTLNPINILDAWNADSATFTLEVFWATLPDHRLDRRRRSAPGGVGEVGSTSRAARRRRHGRQNASPMLR